MNQREQAKRDTMTKIRRVANELFAKQGFDKTTIRDIADNAKVSVGTVMTVGKKDELLVQFFDHLIAEQHDHQSASTVMDVLTPFVEMFDEYGELARKYASILISGDHQSEVFEHLKTRLRGDLSKVIVADPSVGQRRAQQLGDAIYYAYLGILFGFVGSGGQAASELLPKLQATVRTIYPGTEEEKGEEN